MILKKISKVRWMASVQCLIRGHEFDLLGSRDVIGHVTIRLPAAEFLWTQKEKRKNGKRKRKGERKGKERWKGR